MNSRKLPKSIQGVIDQFSKLPGIGPKSASRLAFYLLTRPEQFAVDIGQALLDLRKNLVTCGQCFNVAEEPLDVLALERAGWDGRYHVLGGVISPINGIGPEQLRVRELFDRLKVTQSPIHELVLGTDPSLEGEATALYLQQQIERLGHDLPHLKDLKITRLARGLPVGSDLEYADELTLARALEGRKEY